jgi:hypothetical protein
MSSASTAVPGDRDLPRFISAWTFMISTVAILAYDFYNAARGSYNGFVTREFFAPVYSAPLQHGTRGFEPFFPVRGQMMLNWAGWITVMTFRVVGVACWAMIAAAVPAYVARVVAVVVLAVTAATRPPAAEPATQITRAGRRKIQ